MRLRQMFLGGLKRENNARRNDSLDLKSWVKAYVKDKMGEELTDEESERILSILKNNEIVLEAIEVTADMIISRRK